MDINGVIELVATLAPLGMLVPYAGDALVKLGLIEADEEEEHISEGEE